ncbi:hypothetical protein AMECASPLE_022242, partial [Ameca splendens]
VNNRTEMAAMECEGNQNSGVTAAEVSSCLRRNRKGGEGRGRTGLMKTPAAKVRLA